MYACEAIAPTSKKKNPKPDRRSPYKNPLSIGIDLETGGHVFQMFFSNSQAMMTNYFLSRATGDWSEGDVYFGFNLTRHF